MWRRLLTALRRRPRVVQAAILYRLADRFVVLTSSGRVGYPWFATLPARRLGLDVNDAALAGAVRDLLRQSRCDAAPPADQQAHRRQVLATVGGSSWAELERGSAMCDIRRDETGIHILPSRNETRAARGPTRGFAHLPEREITVAADASDEELGQAIRAALDMHASEHT